MTETSGKNDQRAVSRDHGCCLGRTLDALGATLNGGGAWRGERFEQPELRSENPRDSESSEFKSYLRTSVITTLTGTSSGSKLNKLHQSENRANKLVGSKLAFASLCKSVLLSRSDKSGLNRS